MPKTVLVRDEVGREFTVLEVDALRRGLKVLGEAPADPVIAADEPAAAVAEETSADLAAEKKSRARSSQSAPNPEGTD